MATTYTLNEAARDIAERVILANREELGHIIPATILFINSDGKALVSNGQKTGATTKKIPALYQQLFLQKFGGNYTHVIILFQNNIADLDQHQTALLFYHELKHIGKDGEIIEHDVMEWADVLKAFGPNWTRTSANIPDITDININWRSQPQQLLVFTGGESADDEETADPALALDEDAAESEAETGGPHD
jgi:hypothetical protein